MKIPFSPPYIDQDVIDSVTESLHSGWITTGPKVAALESELTTYLKAKSVVCVNSWTSGATLVLRWLGVDKDDEVIVPAYTYCATAMAVMEAGARPVMVDISSKDLTIDVEKIKQAITPKTKAIITVDIGGCPCQYDKIRELLAEEEIRKQFSAKTEVQEKLNRILLISDSAHAVGAEYQGKTITQWVDVSVQSFHAVKNITSAEGGAICLNLPEEMGDAEELRKYFKLMTLNGQTKDAFTKNQAGAWRYDIVDFGMKINLPDINAAVALAQLRKYDYLLEERKRVFELYHKLLSEYHWAILPPKSNNNFKSVYHLFPLRIKPITEQQRNQIIENLSKKEIATNVHYIPMPELTLFKNMGYKIQDYPQAFDAYTREITLPLYPQLTNQQVEYIVRNLVEEYYSVLNKNQ
jgi:dTDP-4-amino-4,6-dideoxygalactose transaminase